MFLFKRAGGGTGRRGGLESRSAHARESSTPSLPILSDNTRARIHLLPPDRAGYGPFSHCYSSPVEFGKRKAGKGLAVGSLLVSQYAYGNRFPEQIRFRGVRPPVDSRNITAL